ncbi:hypothetical protein Godav_024270, partial [Gossypium davidsonii]|nr:hypothetical protein [Gossypium davidsonii]
MLLLEEQYAIRSVIGYSDIIDTWAAILLLRRNTRKSSLQIFDVPPNEVLGTLQQDKT